MSTRFFIIILFLASFVRINAQTEKCNLQKNSLYDCYIVDAEKTICLAKNSDKDITILLTYASWCRGCKARLPEAIKISEKYNTDFYLLLMDAEEDKIYAKLTKSSIDSYDKQLKTVIISDSLYTEQALKKIRRTLKSPIQIASSAFKEKYVKYLTEITPSGYENTFEVPKYIILNKKGEVLFVSGLDETIDMEYEIITNVIERDRMMNKGADN